MDNQFECPPEVLWDIFEDPEFDRRLEEETGVRREILEERMEEGVQYKKLRCISLREIPAVMKKALGTDQFEFEQENRLDRVAGVLEWTVTTPFLTDRVDAGGTTRVEETATGSRRVVDGVISIRIPLVGKRMEKLLSSNFETSYIKAAAIAVEMLEARHQSAPL